MTSRNLYRMSDQALASEVGGRIEQLRLEANITQKTIADQLGITAKTYRSTIQGHGKFETMIGILRILGKLELVEAFVPETPLSPLMLMKLKGRKRKRAVPEKEEAERMDSEKDDLGW
ncbi:MAG: helix-turn-helix transcriptional regulator [Candidatus Thiodiazotropha sp. 'RUGA']|nr:helix-turn-helix transcriptional regulator [Candidatus Thiodiazotropha sp. 'RUGA']